MPNGNPSFHEEELPALESFFSPIADTLNQFATQYNLRLERYYHQFPCWTFYFRHPKGGVASLEVFKESDDSIKVYSNWWLDDYDKFTRFIKRSESTAFKIGSEHLAEILECQFREVLSWTLGQWTLEVQGYEQAWSLLSKNEIERDVEKYPIPSF